MAEKAGLIYKILSVSDWEAAQREIGRASCRERVFALV